MKEEWRRGDVLVWSVFAVLALAIFGAAGIIFQISGSSPILAWIIATVFGIYIGSIQSELSNKYRSAEIVFKSALGRMLGFLGTWLWWWFCTSSVILLLLVAGMAASQTGWVQAMWAVFFVLLIGTYLYHQSPGVKKITFWVYLTTLFGIAFVVLASFGSFSFASIPVEYELDGMLLAVFLGLVASSVSMLSSYLSGEAESSDLFKEFMFGSVCVAGIVVVLVFVFSASYSWDVLSADNFLINISQGMIGNTVIPLIIFYAAVTIAAMIWFFVASKTAFGLAQDSLLFRRVGIMHPQYKTMGPAFEFQAIVCIFFILLSQKDIYIMLGTCAAIISLVLQMILVSFCILKAKDRKARGKDIIPISVSALAVIGIIYLQWIFLNTSSIGFTCARVVASLIVLGVLTYCFMELYYSSRAVRKTSDLIAYLTLVFEGMILPRNVRRIVLAYLGELKGKRVLELGCSVGTLTIGLARAVGSEGKIYATDISEKDLLIARRRMIRKGIYHVRMIHDPNHTKRVHPKIPKVNAVVSVGMLGYFSNPLDVLKTLNRKLARGDPIVFVDYDKFFDVIPNQDWLRHNSAIVRTFKKSGFSVEVVRRQGFAWKYVIIHGKKVQSM